MAEWIRDVDVVLLQIIGGYDDSSHWMGMDGRMDGICKI